MDTQVFIIAAYAIAGVLLAGLCLATWLASRRVKAQLSQRDAS